MSRTEFLEDTRLEARDALQAVIAAYDLAKADATARLPTSLMAAVEMARRVL